MISKITLSPPENSFEAIIFDLDGTLVDSMPLHFKAWCHALGKQGHPEVFSEDVFYAMGGRPTRDIVKDINGDNNLNLDAEEVIYAKKKFLLSHLDEIELIPEVVAVIEENRGKVPLAIATGSSREVAEKILQQLGVSDWFAEVVTSNDVENGKPAPDIFLEAAARLEIDPKKCLVYEDGRAGIVAAREAGMEVVVVPTPLHLD